MEIVYFPFFNNYNVFIKYDILLDMLNIQDAILMGVKTDAYDITGDGLVNLLDLVRIKKILAGKA